MAGSFFLWAIHEGDHPLRRILQHQIRTLFANTRMTFDYTWLYVPCHTTPLEASQVWINMCHAWNSIKGNLRPCLPDNYQGWQDLPLWHPHVNHISPQLPNISRRAQIRFARTGFLSMGDVAANGGGPLPWIGGPNLVLPHIYRRAYDKLIQNLQPHHRLSPDRYRICSFFPGRTFTV